jgi:hypothetical protein
MHKVSPRLIAYVACQVSGNVLRLIPDMLNIVSCSQLRFALSAVTSWCSVDGDFDYVQFWQIIVDFFEKAHGRLAKRKVD